MDEDSRWLYVDEISYVYFFAYLQPLHIAVQIEEKVSKYLPV